MTFEHIFRDITLIVFCILSVIVFLGAILNRSKDRGRDKDHGQRDETFD